MPGPALLERLHRTVGDIGRFDHPHAPAVEQADPVARGFGQMTEKFRDAVKRCRSASRFRSARLTTKSGIRNDDVANQFRRQHPIQHLVQCGTAAELRRMVNPTELNERPELFRKDAVHFGNG
jgi:hypothetical protein